MLCKISSPMTVATDGMFRILFRVIVRCLEATVSGVTLWVVVLITLFGLIEPFV